MEAAGVPLCCWGGYGVLLEPKGSGGYGLMGNGSDNQYVVGWCMWLGTGVGGHGIHHGGHQKQHPLHQQKRRSSVIPKIEVVMQQQGGGCGDEGNNDGGNNGSGDDVKLAVTRAGIGWRDESVW